MEVHLVDGTWELFRHHHAVPPHRVDDRDVAAVRGVLRSMVRLLERGATHVAVATDHVIESFRNDLWPGYKTGDGIDPVLRSQFVPLETTLAAAGIAVWPMVDQEADDGLAAGAAVAAADPRVARVLVCSPDKDLAQCVRGARVVQFDRRGDGTVRDEAEIRARFGVGPARVPDWLALVGDAADGYPGIPGFGARTAAQAIRHFGGIADMPADAAAWVRAGMRTGPRLAATLAERRDEALLFLRLATLREDAPVMPGGVDGILWRGPGDGCAAACRGVGAPEVPERLERLAEARAAAGIGGATGG